MTTIGDRIRIRRTTGRRGKRRYSLLRTQASRASESQHDVVEESDQQTEDTEAKAAMASQRELENHHPEANGNHEETDRSRSRNSVSTHRSHRNVERSRSREPRREPITKRRTHSHRDRRDPVRERNGARRIISDTSGTERRSSRYHPYRGGLSWWDNIDRGETESFPYADTISTVPQRNNPFLSNRARSVRYSRDEPRQIQDQNPFTGIQRSNYQTIPPFSTSRSFQFPTEQNGSFARAMSAIACNAEVGAQGRFNLISGENDTFKENISQALALKFNLKTTQQANEKALLDIKKSRGSSAGLKQALQARAAIYGDLLDPS